MAATRAEVAALAGVSPSTVTYVLTGQRPTSERTRARVRHAIEVLGYEPNRQASSLASRSVRSAGVLLRMERESVEVGDLEYIDGIRSSLEPAGIQVVVPMGLRGRMRTNVHELVRSQSIDSAILMDVAVGDEREELLLAERVPTVLIGSSLRQHGAPSIDADFSQMARISLEHLAGLGHRRVLAAARMPQLESARAYLAQREAMLAEASRLGIEIVTRFLPDNAVLGGSLVTQAGLVGGCTAVLSNNPAATSGLMAAALALGLQVPRDFSVLTMAGAVATDGAGRMLSETNVDSGAMGRRAGRILLRLLEDCDLDEHVLVPARVIDRGSTGPLPA